MKNTIKNIISTIFILLLVVLIVGGLVFVCFGYKTAIGYGHSMEPTCKDGQLTIVVKSRTIKRGDIVIINNDNNFLTDNGVTKEDSNYQKRVVAIEGDTVESIEGKIYINGEVYISDTTGFAHSYKESYKITLGEKECFVIGDNFGASFDSRRWENKAVPYENIDYKVVYIIP